jgi:hypothetical protein
MAVRKSIDVNSIDRQRLLLALRDVGAFQPVKKEKLWFSPISELPANLRSALLLELESGNQIVSIDKGNWPQEGSIFICLRECFKNDFNNWRDGVSYHALNDIRYWMAELRETVDGIDYFIIH